MQRKIKVLVVEPNELPREEMIENTLKYYEELYEK